MWKSGSAGAARTSKTREALHCLSWRQGLRLSLAGTRCLWFLAWVGTSCSTVEPRALAVDEVVATVTSRGEDSRPLLAEALELFDETPLGLELPEVLDPEQDAGRDVFWHAHALAFAPEVRAARRAVLATRHEVGAAGRPGPVNASFSVDDLGDVSRQQNVSATVDLLRLLGLGRSAAEREVAQQVVSSAVGELEVEVWRAVYAIDEARVRLATARGEQEALRTLIAQADVDWRRIELLFEHGRLGAGPHGRARAVMTELRSEESRLAAEAVRAREDLALASGLPPGSTALATVTETLPAVGALLPGPDDDERETPPDPALVPPAAELFNRLPVLRGVRRDYALAEARLRDESAASWPTLRVGPTLKILPDEVLTGGVLSLELPWPGVTRARVQGALERREAARERVEDALVIALAQAQARRRELLLAREFRLRDVAAQMTGSARAWRGARAMLSVRDTAGALEAWLDALALCARGQVAGYRAARRELLAGLAYREATGGQPGLDFRAEGNTMEVNP